ncbi:MAG: transmembrane 220 family protein [Cyclobacteriaceae bacterium]|nr:transmembrane 220 family protein [Cyclobacteriaceae bacterium]
MKIVNAVFILIFTYFIVVQYNDPDPMMWIVIYAYAAMVCVMAILGRLKKYFIYGGLLIFVVLAGTLFTSMIEWVNAGNQTEIFDEMSKERMYVEETREFFGLVIGIAALVVNGVTIKK